MRQRKALINASSPNTFAQTAQGFLRLRGRQCRMGIAIRALSASNRLPVLIVGGGLGGFTAALSLHRAGIRNNIVMRESKFTQHTRNGVFLGSSAIRILDRLGLGPHYRTLGTPLHRIQVEDVYGKEIISLRLDDIGSEIWALPRANLQQLLFESIPPDTVHFDTKFRSLHFDGEGVQVEVRRGAATKSQAFSSDPSLFEANFVIGADGHNSTVRTFMSRSAMTVPSGTTIWRAVVQNRDVRRYPLHLGKEMWGADKRFGFARMNPEEVIWWAVITESHEAVLRPFTPHLLRSFDSFPEVCRELVSSTGSDRDIDRTEMKQVWPEKFPWVDHNSSRIALVGDAGRPGHFGNFHSGQSFAIEDSYFLAHYLAEQNEKGMLQICPKLQGYEDSREEQMSTTWRHSYAFSRLNLWQSPFRRYLARKLLYLSLERMVSTGSASTLPMTAKRFPGVHSGNEKLNMRHQK